MSNGDFPWQTNGTTQPPVQAAGVTDVVTQLQAIVRQLTALRQSVDNLVTAISGRVVEGTFTATSGTTSVVTQPAVKSNSVVTLTPTNSAAATFLAGKSYFITIVAGTSFTVTFTSGAGGTETFAYTINTPT